MKDFLSPFSQGGNVRSSSFGRPSTERIEPKKGGVPGPSNNDYFRFNQSTHGDRLAYPSFEKEEGLVKGGWASQERVPFLWENQALSQGI